MKTFKDKLFVAGVTGLVVLAVAGERPAARYAPRSEPPAKVMASPQAGDPVDALRTVDAALAKNPSDGGLLLEKGNILWSMYRTKSAMDAFAQAARDPKTAAAAQYSLGRIYFFRGWQSEGAFPGWHEEPEFRDQAMAAFRAAAAANPSWSEPQIGIGDSLLMYEQPADALAAFERVLQLSPSAALARTGRWKALNALNRADAVKTDVAASAKSDDAGQLAAAREGYRLLGQDADAEAVAAQILERFPVSAAAAQIEAARIAAARQAKQYPAVIEQATAYALRFASSPHATAVQDALIEAYVATPSTDPQVILDAVKARITMRPDPATYMAGANALATRNALLDDVIRLAEASIPAAETFINENIGSYKMSGKVQGSLGRSRASATDMVGWAYFLKKDLEKAGPKLEEAERLSRGLDMTNQFHLAELARSRGDLEGAREHYLSELTLQGPPPLAAAGKKALADVYQRLGNAPADFDTYLKDELDRRHEARKTALVQSMVDRKVPEMKLTDVSGNAVDVAALRGRVLLLNFFSSW